MNTGQRLVELSGLPSGSALAHFAAITQTGGTGPGSLLLVSKAAVQISYPEHRYHTHAIKTNLIDMGSPDTPSAFAITATRNEVVVTTQVSKSLSPMQEELSVITRSA